MTFPLTFQAKHGKIRESQRDKEGFMQLMGPSEAAEYLAARGMDVSAGTAREWMRTGRMPGWKLTGANTYVTRKRDVDAALATTGLPAPAENGGEAEWLSTAAVRDLLAEAGVERSRETVSQWFRSGRLPARKVGKWWAMRAGDLEAMLATGWTPPKAGRPCADR